MKDAEGVGNSLMFQRMIFCRSLVMDKLYQVFEKWWGLGGAPEIKRQKERGLFGDTWPACVLEQKQANGAMPPADRSLVP